MLYANFADLYTHFELKRVFVHFRDEEIDLEYIFEVNL